MTGNFHSRVWHAVTVRRANGTEFATARNMAAFSSLSDLARITCGPGDKLNMICVCGNSRKAWDQVKAWNKELKEAGKLFEGDR